MDKKVNKIREMAEKTFLLSISLSFLFSMGGVNYGNWFFYHALMVQLGMVVIGWIAFSIIQKLKS